MKNRFISLLIQWLSRKVDGVVIPEKEPGWEYRYISTKDTDDAGKFVSWEKSVETNSVSPLLETREKEGWMVIKFWFTNESYYRHTHWYLGRKVSNAISNPIK